MNDMALINSERNSRMLSWVKAGATYKETANLFGVTRNVVAGVCMRAGLKVGSGEENGRRSRVQRAYVEKPEHLARRRQMMAAARSRKVEHASR